MEQIIKNLKDLKSGIFKDEDAVNKLIDETIFLAEQQGLSAANVGYNFFGGTCGQCVWRCFAVRSDELHNEQWCMKRRHIFLKYLFENYNENTSGCALFKKGKHSFYGEPSQK